MEARFGSPSQIATGLRLEHHLADASRTSSATLRPDHAAAFQACIPSPLERHRAAGSEAPLFRHEGMLGSRATYHVEEMRAGQQRRQAP